MVYNSFFFNVAINCLKKKEKRLEWVTALIVAPKIVNRTTNTMNLNLCCDVKRTLNLARNFGMRCNRQLYLIIKKKCFFFKTTKCFAHVSVTFTQPSVYIYQGVWCDAMLKASELLIKMDIFKHSVYWVLIKLSTSFQIRFVALVRSQRNPKFARWQFIGINPTYIIVKPWVWKNNC